ncbi:MAG TPA: Gfo/Idh/MocA family oxidoreductase [Pirellulales bacterium]|nr:Gfo/Idh/MocA family oxidoreductase [Pirellulales bacterium]
MPRQSSRRQFMQTTAATGVGFWVAAGLHAEESKSPNEKIRFACVGIGGKGESDSEDAGKSGDVVAICDVDDLKLNAAGKKFEGAKKYNDFRKMLDEMGSNIDAVTVSTPDHCHAVVAAMAMSLGKHCFCQKPLTHSIWEARRLGDIAREKKVATQMGNQGTSYDPLRRAAAIIQSGALGKVTEVHVWTNRPIWAQGGNRPETDEVPSYLHWEEWLGPAAYRPFGKGYHPFSWRGWWDFGTGALGDMACHTVNMPYMALALKDPTSVQARTSGHNRDSYPKWSTIDFQFPSNDKRPAVKMTWYDGGDAGEKPAKHLFEKADPTKSDCLVLGDKDVYAKEFKEGKHPFASGCLVVGEKGSLYAPGDYAERQIVLTNGINEPKVDWIHSPGHFEEWVRAIRGGEAAMSNFPNYAGGLTETILLGNLAVWVAPEAGQMGKKIEWNAKEMVATNAPEVAEVIRPKYRDGYHV